MVGRWESGGEGGKGRLAYTREGAATVAIEEWQQRIPHALVAVGTFGEYLCECLFYMQPTLSAFI